MIDDIIAEVCEELSLLSDFASNIEHGDAATLDQDVTLLLFGLSSLAAHARRVKSADAGEVRVFLDGSTSLSQQTEPHEETQHRVLHRPESGLDSQHKWVLAVLKDLTNYTRTNDLHGLADSLENIIDWNRDQLSETAAVDPAIECISTDNIVAFTLDRRSKVSGEPAP